MSYLLSPVSPVVLDFPDAGSKWKERNDRQLRLWGVHGQDRIDNANVCLLNASAVGCEVLKNIVLPGFGQFTIVDGRKVTPRDLGNNFFVTRDSIDEPIAKVVVENLVELNPDAVMGNFLIEDPCTVIDKSPDFFDSYNFIIASQMDTATVRKLAKLCWERNKVLMVVRSYGFIGYIRVAVRNHEVTESKLDSEQEDLRINAPWGELLQFAESQQLDQMGEIEFRHTPYVIVLIKALQKWRLRNTTQQGNDGVAMLLPSSRSEKEEFTKSVQIMARDYSQDENVQEAIKKIFQAWTVPEIPDDVRKIFDDERCSDEILAREDTDEFWFMARAMREFVQHEGNGMLPLQGRVPDMYSDTERYVRLQSIYRRKARNDMMQVHKYLIKLLERFDRPTSSISEMDLKEFCKNCLYLRAYRYRSIEQELDAVSAQREEIQNMMYDPTSSAILYLMLRASDSFFAEHGYYPGESRPPSSSSTTSDMKDDDSEFDESLLSEEQYESDSKELHKHLLRLLKELDVVDHAFDDLENYAKEMVRYGNCELHNISALVGGVGAQELIKLCTKQRLPLCNTWVFNGMSSTSSTFEA